MSSYGTREKERKEKERKRKERMNDGSIFFYVEIYFNSRNKMTLIIFRVKIDLM